MAFSNASSFGYPGQTTCGHNCMLITGRNEYVGGPRAFVATGQGEPPIEGYDIRIGFGRWIPCGSVIGGAVPINDNTIIGAGSLVTRDVPRGVFAAGVPARVLRALENSSPDPARQR